MYRHFRELSFQPVLLVSNQTPRFARTHQILPETLEQNKQTSIESKNATFVCYNAFAVCYSRVVFLLLLICFRYSILNCFWPIRRRSYPHSN